MYKLQIIGSIGELLIGRGQSLSVAESVTSGHLQAALSLATEASRFFHGGITTYNLGQKARHLHVNPIHASSCNSVSPTIAEEMALNANRLFTSDWSIAVTGYASPLPDEGIKDVFAFYAIACRQELATVGRVESKEEGALNVQIDYTNQILEIFRQHLNEQNYFTSPAAKSING